MKTPAILLVEDNLLSQEMTSSFLREEGFDCSVAGNGKIALEMLKTSSFDLVLMDIEMPTMDGITAAKIIRKDLGLKVPLIALSAHDSPDQNQKFMEVGMNSCLHKTAEKDELLAAILRELKLETPPQGESKNSGKTVSSKRDEVIDLSYLEQISMGKKNFFYGMIDIFLLQNTNDMQKLKLAVEEMNFETIRLLAHKTKTSITFIGLEKHLYDELEEMERLSLSNQNPKRIRELFLLVDSICTRACKELISVKEKNK
jgi:CheY-like chemotaxis protein